jgi:hypothetical protein
MRRKIIPEDFEASHLYGTLEVQYGYKLTL